MATPHSALLVSLTLAICTVVILLIICLPTAWWLAQYQGRRSSISNVDHASIVLPPTVLGFYLLVLFAPNGALGQFWQALTGSTLAFSFGGILFGSLIYSLPFVMQPLIQALQQTGLAYYQVMQSLGVPRWRCILFHVLPVCKASIITAATLGFAHTMGEFGLILLIGGNIPGETRVLSVELYNQIMVLDYASAPQSALLLLVTSALSLWLLYWLNPQQAMARVSTTQPYQRMGLSDLTRDHGVFVRQVQVTDSQSHCRAQQRPINSFKRRTQKPCPSRHSTQPLRVFITTDHHVAAFNRA